MAVYTHVSTEVLTAFLADYDVGNLVRADGIAQGVENTNYRLTTTRGRYVLTLYERRVAAGDLPFFLALTDHLADRGLPVPRAIPDRSGTAILQLQGRPACLIRFLSGSSISHPTSAQAHAAGEALGRMHAAVADFAPTRANSMGLATWRPLLERCGRDLDGIAPGLHARIAAALGRVEAEWAHDLPTSAIHADLFPDNVLAEGDRVTGLIDFYFACTDVRAYDLAVTHTAWTFDLSGAPTDPAIGGALLDGYRAAHPLSDAERFALPVLARGACLRFALSRAWDWLHTPPDALVTRKDPLAYLRRLAWYEANPQVFA